MAAEGGRAADGDPSTTADGEGAVVELPLARSAASMAEGLGSNSGSAAGLATARLQARPQVRHCRHGQRVKNASVNV